jgi:hypothetical protein
VAEHNAISYAANLLKAFPRAVGLASETDGVTRLGETLTPIFNIFTPEYAFLRDERLCAGSGIQTAAAGTVTSCHLLNPANSGLIVVVDSIRVSSDTTGEVRIHVRTPVSGAPSLKSFADLRLGGTLQPSLLFWTSNVLAAVTGTRLSSNNILANTTMELLPSPIVLPPDVPTGQGSIAIFHVTLLTPTLETSVRWRERTAYPGELRS